MTYNTQNYWVSGLCPLSGILNTRKHNVSETGPVSVLMGVKETPTLLGPLERANLNHWSSPLILRTETDLVSETLCFLVFKIPDDGLSPEAQ
jgi:hypothetical protein